jgi:hypothetical protein
VVSQISFFQEIKDYEPTADEDDNPNNPFILTTITNEFEFPVNLYWVEPVSKKRELMQELLGEELDMRVIPGHVFEVCKTTTGEVVHTFQVLSNAKNSYGEVEIEVGPKKQNPEDFVEIKVRETFIHIAYTDVSYFILLT